jgi:hypothetical protein
MTPRSLSVVLAAAAAWSAACGSTSSSSTSLLNLNAPTDLAFGCFGGLRLTGGGRAGTAADPLTETAMPIGACDIYAQATTDSLASELPLGQEDLHATDKSQPALSVSYYAFVLQTESGTLSLGKFPAKLPTAPIDATACDAATVATDCPPSWTCLSNVCTPPTAHAVVAPGDLQMLDLDPLTPGANGVSVGALPVAVAIDQSGCYAVTANSGSCDLSVVDVASVASFKPEPIVNRLDVTNASGDPVVARPAAMIAANGWSTIGVACPAAATGVLWIAYPDCHLVAAVDPGTGVIKAGVKFAADGTATITSGAVSCPAQCGGEGTITDGFRPMTVDLADDHRVGTRRLAIGGEGASVVTVVDLDGAFLPTAIKQVALSGDVDVSRVAISPQIGMGGTAGDVIDDGAVGGQSQFVYAVASDGTVRVADVLDVNAECDTQVDPRYLAGETDVQRLSCMPVGDLNTPPRRSTANGPGIQLTNHGKPTAVTIVHAVPRVTSDIPIAASTLIGWFAMVTATGGDVYIVNIDDDNYPDVEDPTSPLAVTLPLALPHQLRDAIPDRGALALDKQAVAQPICVTASQDTPATTDLTSGGPRMVLVSDAGRLVEQSLSVANIALAKASSLPNLRKVRCDGSDTGTIGPVGVNEMSFEAPVATRKQVFGDLRAMPFDEIWTATWEGALSNDDSTSAIDGPRIRSGLTMVDGTGMRVVEAGAPYCAAGVEPYDEVTLRGCDPTNNSLDCDVGHTCYAHPDSPTGIGACLPTAQVDALAGACRDFLITERRYAATTVKSGELRLIGRRRVLRTTPITGCTSAAQCGELEAVAQRLPSTDQPASDNTVITPHTWACEADPSRAPGIDRCVMSCTTSAECSAGSVCESGRCVEGVIPPLQCALGIQRYDLRASEAFTVLGSRTGYLHPWIVGPDNSCVRDPAAPRNLVGRIPLRVPRCTSARPSPNPCSEPISTFEAEKTFDDTCTVAANAHYAARATSSIRFNNPQVLFHLIDLTYPGDARCIGDRGGTLVDIPVVFPGYAVTFRLQAGFLAKRLPVPTALSQPVNVIRGPGQSIWVVDQGDVLQSNGGSTRGAVVRLESTGLATTSTAY